MLLNSVKVLTEQWPLCSSLTRSWRLYCFVFSDFFFFYLFIRLCAWVEIVFTWWVHNDEQGHSRQCPSLRCKKHYMIFLFPPFKRVNQLSFLWISSTTDKRLTSHSHVMTAVNGGYLAEALKRLDGRTLSRCRPDFLSLNVWLSNLSVRLWPQLTSAFFFSNVLWQKQRAYANWQWQVSTWTTAERKKTNATSA